MKLDSGCVFKIEPTGRADGLDVGVRERRIDNGSKVFGLNIRKDEITITEMGSQSVGGQ